MNIKNLHKIFLRSKGVTTDTRTIEKGQVFFALKGENFNGNKYALNALEKGASYAVVDEDLEPHDKLIKVDNVLECLQNLATYHRDFLNIPILAITGTNGKTTTKELISSVLAKKYNLAYTKGNFNNHIGVPLTILSFTQKTELAVVEMGANHPGEIDALCKIAKPDYGIITNIGKAHLEGFGSFEGVVQTKTELYRYLQSKTDSKLFVNADDSLLLGLSKNFESISYGRGDNAKTKVKFKEAQPFLKLQWNNYLINTNLVGAYNFANVAAAICVGSYFEVPDNLIVEALTEYNPQNKRSQLVKTKNNNTVIVDAYNANPESMRLSISNFSNFPEKDKILILGDMLELGNQSRKEHKAIIELVEALKFKDAYFVGSHFNELKAEYKHFQFVKDTKSICELIMSNSWKNKTVLLKASRGIKLEDALQSL